MSAEQQLWQVAAVVAVLLGLGLIEWRRGEFFSPQATHEDNRLDLAMALLMPAVSAVVLRATLAACEAVMPMQRGAWAHWSWWEMAAVLLIADDFTQYWWHRLSHQWARLWPLHRAHHSASYMGVRIVYRNNIFYYAMMPGLWLSGVLIYLGFGWVYVAYTVTKMAVIIGAHSSLRWDEPLLRRRWLHPLLWVLERTLSTPATHFAHHALREDDGVGHHSGNFGNLLFLWDVLFGTARLSRRYPPDYGLEDDRQFGPESWWTQITYPLTRSHRAQTVLGRQRNL